MCDEISRRVSKCFDGLAEGYERRAPKHSYFPIKWIPTHLEDIACFEPCEVLDLGCGTGLNIKVLCEHRSDIRATGVDGSPRMLDFARASDRYNRLYSHDLSKELPAEIASGTFDLVTVLSVLEYVADVETCLAECHRVLKPSGILWASFRSYEADDEGSPPRYVRFEGVEMTHHSAGEILYMMRRAGMEVIGIDAITGFITSAGFAVPYYAVRARKTQLANIPRGENS